MTRTIIAAEIGFKDLTASPQGGTVYMASANGNLRAFSPSGNPKWAFPLHVA